MIANPKRFAVVNKESITYDDDKETALVKIPKYYKDDLRKVYCLFEVTRHDGDMLVDIFWDRTVPDAIAAENPAAGMDGYYVMEWEIK